MPSRTLILAFLSATLLKAPLSVACCGEGNPGPAHHQRFKGFGTVLVTLPSQFVEVQYVELTLDLRINSDGVVSGVYRCRQSGKSAGAPRFCVGKRAQVGSALLNAQGFCGADLKCGFNLALPVAFPDGQICDLSGSVPFLGPGGRTTLPAISGPYSCRGAAGQETAQGFFGVMQNTR
jgi:hypothetical protein